MPDVPLPATDGETVSLARVRGRAVVYAYPRTGVPGETSPVADWDQIPGARGCTPQSCAFRDHFADLRACGVTAVFGLSSQTTAYQQEMARRHRARAVAPRSDKVAEPRCHEWSKAGRRCAWTRARHAS